MKTNGRTIALTTRNATLFPNIIFASLSALLVLLVALFFSSPVSASDSDPAEGGVITSATYLSVTATNAQFSTIKVGTENNGGVAYFYGSLLNSSTGTDGSDNPLTIADHLRIDNTIYRSEPGGGNNLLLADTLQPTGDYNLGTDSSRWTTVYGKTANFSEAVQVASLTVGSQGVGGVTYFNGTIVNNTTGDNDSNTPVTIGDNLRVDGAIQRMGEGGDYPIKLADTLIPDTNNTYSLGTSDNKWSNLYANDATFSGTVSIANLEGSNNITTTNIINNSITSTKLADNAVTNGKVADSAIAEAKIENDAVTEAKLAAIDTPADGEYLAWNANTSLNATTGAGFEWVPAPSDGSGSGETNIASNQGTGGVGPYLQKTGVDLEFKNINAGSSKVTVTNDAANNEIDIDVNEANLALANISGTLAVGKGGTGATTAGAARTALGLGNVENTALTTWTGSGSITTMGTISAGTWNGTAIANADVDNDLTISGGTINDSIIGATTPAAGTFANLQTGYDTTDGQLTIYADQATDRSVIIQPNAAMTEDTTYTLPPDNGGVNEVLTSNGAGALTWGSDTTSAHGMVFRRVALNTIGTTWTPIPFTGGQVGLSNITHDLITVPEDVTVNVAGLYEISYTANAFRNASINTQYARVVKAGSTELDGGNAFYTQGIGWVASVQQIFLAQLAAGDILTLELKTDIGTFNVQPDPQFDNDVSAQMTLVRIAD
ncbi:MAG: hypothetical protein HQ530_04765 [Parcubacteria group bacterium]|nr:hypothetical protein [Parcubacteria group bacterium]